MTQLEQVQDICNKVQEGEISPIQGYKEAREILDEADNLAKTIKDYMRTEIESGVCDEVESNPEEYPQFTVSYRAKYKFDANPLYKEKKKELKDLEGTLKKATEIFEKGETMYNSEGEQIEPVEVTNTKILTFRKNAK
jgi:hypothetical protein